MLPEESGIFHTTDVYKRQSLFHTCHNVTQAEMDGGATYLTLMEGNLERLRTAFTER